MTEARNEYIAQQHTTEKPSFGLWITPLSSNLSIRLLQIGVISDWGVTLNNNVEIYLNDAFKVVEEIRKILKLVSAETVFTIERISSLIVIKEISRSEARAAAEPGETLDPKHLLNEIEKVYPNLAKKLQGKDHERQLAALAALPQAQANERTVRTILGTTKHGRRGVSLTSDECKQIAEIIIKGRQVKEQKPQLEDVDGEAAFLSIAAPFLERIRKISEEGFRFNRRHFKTWAKHVIMSRWLMKEAAGINIPEVRGGLNDYEFEQLGQRVQFAASAERDDRLRQLLQQTPQGSALVLGIGRGFDVPLLELALAFREVVVVDLYKKAILDALQKAREELQSLGTPPEKIDEVMGRIRIKMADATGIAAEFSQKVEDLAAAQLPQRERIEQLAAFYREFAGRPTWSVTLEGNYDFVTSSLVLSAAIAGLGGYAKERLKLETIQNQDFSQAEQALIQAIIHQHIQHLKQWVRTDGKVYWADTINLVPVIVDPKTGRENYVIAFTQPMIPMDLFFRTVQANFEPQILSRWDFTVSAPQVPMEKSELMSLLDGHGKLEEKKFGRGYNVVAVKMRPLSQRAVASPSPRSEARSGSKDKSEVIKLADVMARFRRAQRVKNYAALFFLTGILGTLTFFIAPSAPKDPLISPALKIILNNLESERLPSSTPLHKMIYWQNNPIFKWRTLTSRGVGWLHELYLESPKPTEEDRVWIIDLPGHFLRLDPDGSLYWSEQAKLLFDGTGYFLKKQPSPWELISIDEADLRLKLAVAKEKLYEVQISANPFQRVPGFRTIFNYEQRRTLQAAEKKVLAAQNRLDHYLKTGGVLEDPDDNIEKWLWTAGLLAVTALGGTLFWMGRRKYNRKERTDSSENSSVHDFNPRSEARAGEVSEFTPEEWREIREAFLKWLGSYLKTIQRTLNTSLTEEEIQILIREPQKGLNFLGYKLKPPLQKKKLQTKVATDLQRRIWDLRQSVKGKKKKTQENLPEVRSETKEQLKAVMNKTYEANINGAKQLLLDTIKVMRNGSLANEQFLNELEAAVAAKTTTELAPQFQQEGSVFYKNLSSRMDPAGAITVEGLFLQINTFRLFQVFELAKRLDSVGLFYWNIVAPVARESAGTWLLNHLDPKFLQVTHRALRSLGKVTSPRPAIALPNEKLKANLLKAESTLKEYAAYAIAAEYFELFHHYKALEIGQEKGILAPEDLELIKGQEEITLRPELLDTKGERLLLLEQEIRYAFARSIRSYLTGRLVDFSELGPYYYFLLQFANGNLPDNIDDATLSLLVNMPQSLPSTVLLKSTRDLLSLVEGILPQIDIPPPRSEVRAEKAVEKPKNGGSEYYAEIDARLGPWSEENFQNKIQDLKRDMQVALGRGTGISLVTDYLIMKTIRILMLPQESAALFELIARAEKASLDFEKMNSYIEDSGTLRRRYDEIINKMDPNEMQNVSLQDLLTSLSREWLNTMGSKREKFLQSLKTPETARLYLREFSILKDQLHQLTHWDFWHRNGQKEWVEVFHATPQPLPVQKGHVQVRGQLYAAIVPRFTQIFGHGDIIYRLKIPIRRITGSYLIFDYPKEGVLDEILRQSEVFVTPGEVEVSGVYYTGREESNWDVFLASYTSPFLLPPQESVIQNSILKRAGIPIDARSLSRDPSLLTFDAEKALNAMNLSPDLQKRLESLITQGDLPLSRLMASALMLRLLASLKDTRSPHADLRPSIARLLQLLVEELRSIQSSDNAAFSSAHQLLNPERFLLFLQYLVEPELKEPLLYVVAVVIESERLIEETQKWIQPPHGEGQLASILDLWEMHVRHGIYANFRDLKYFLEGISKDPSAVISKSNQGRIKSILEILEDAISASDELQIKMQKHFKSRSEVRSDASDVFYEHFREKLAAAFPGKVSPHLLHQQGNELLEEGEVIATRLGEGWHIFFSVPSGTKPARVYRVGSTEQWLIYPFWELGMNLAYIDEAKILSALGDIPGIPKLAEVGLTDKGFVWIAQEQIAGQTFQEHRFGSLQDLLKAFIQAAQILQQVHLKDYVHADIHNSNLMIDSLENVWVIDWEGQAKKNAGIALHAPGYSPLNEEESGPLLELDSRSDIFNFLITLALALDHLNKSMGGQIQSELAAMRDRYLRKILKGNFTTAREAFDILRERITLSQTVPEDLRVQKPRDEWPPDIAELILELQQDLKGISKARSEARVSRRRFLASLAAAMPVLNFLRGRSTAQEQLIQPAQDPLETLKQNFPFLDFQDLNEIKKADHDLGIRIAAEIKKGFDEAERLRPGIVKQRFRNENFTIASKQKKIWKFIVELKTKEGMPEDLTVHFDTTFYRLDPILIPLDKLERELWKRIVVYLVSIGSFFDSGEYELWKQLGGQSKEQDAENLRLRMEYLFQGKLNDPDMQGEMSGVGMGTAIEAERLFTKYLEAYLGLRQLPSPDSALWKFMDLLWRNGKVDSGEFRAFPWILFLTAAGVLAAAETGANIFLYKRLQRERALREDEARIARAMRESLEQSKTEPGQAPQDSDGNPSRSEVRSQANAESDEINSLIEQIGGQDLHKMNEAARRLNEIGPSSSGRVLPALINLLENSKRPILLSDSIANIASGNPKHAIDLLMPLIRNPKLRLDALVTLIKIVQRLPAEKENAGQRLRSLLRENNLDEPTQADIKQALTEIGVSPQDEALDIKINDLLPEIGFRYPESEKKRISFIESERFRVFLEKVFDSSSKNSSPTSVRVFHFNPRTTFGHDTSRWEFDGVYTVSIPDSVASFPAAKLILQTLESDSELSGLGAEWDTKKKDLTSFFKNRFRNQPWETLEVVDDAQWLIIEMTRLVRRLMDERTDWKQFTFAVDGLKEIGFPAVPSLVAALKDPTIQNRNPNDPFPGLNQSFLPYIYLIESLGDLGAVASLAILDLEQALTHPDEKVRIAAEKSLAEIRSEVRSTPQLNLNVLEGAREYIVGGKTLRQTIPGVGDGGYRFVSVKSLSWVKRSLFWLLAKTYTSPFLIPFGHFMTPQPRRLSREKSSAWIISSVRKRKENLGGFVTQSWIAVDQFASQMQRGLNVFFGKGRVAFEDSLHRIAAFKHMEKKRRWNPRPFETGFSVTNIRRDRDKIHELNDSIGGIHGQALRHSETQTSRKSRIVGRGDGSSPRSEARAMKKINIELPDYFNEEFALDLLKPGKFPLTRQEKRWVRLVVLEKRTPEYIQSFFGVGLERLRQHRASILKKAEAFRRSAFEEIRRVEQEQRQAQAIQKAIRTVVGSDKGSLEAREAAAVLIRLGEPALALLFETIQANPEAAEKLSPIINLIRSEVRLVHHLTLAVTAPEKKGILTEAEAGEVILYVEAKGIEKLREAMKKTLEAMNRPQNTKFLSGVLELVSRLLAPEETAMPQPGRIPLALHFSKADDLRPFFNELFKAIKKTGQPAEIFSNVDRQLSKGLNQEEIELFNPRRLREQEMTGGIRVFTNEAQVAMALDREMNLNEIFQGLLFNEENMPLDEDSRYAKVVLRAGFLVRLAMILNDSEHRAKIQERINEARLDTRRVLNPDEIKQIRAEYLKGVLIRALEELGYPNVKEAISRGNFGILTLQGKIIAAAVAAEYQARSEIRKAA